MNRVIVVGLDGSETSWKAFDEALKQAQMSNSSLHAVSVQEELPVSPNALEIINADETANELTNKIWRQAEAVAAKTGIEVNYVKRHGESVKALLDCATELKADLLVIGKKGRSSIWSALVGTSVDKIVREAHCSVLVVQ